MICLHCKLKRIPSAETWDLASGLLHQFHSRGIDEGEEPPPAGGKALVAANEFECALEPGILSPPREFKAYFENRRDADRAKRAVEPVFRGLEPFFSIEEVEPQDYGELWRQNVKPIRVPPMWLIRAPWHDAKDLSTTHGVPPAQSERELVMEPGMAFGTGSHETTQSCLQLIAETAARLDNPEKRHVLDFGCGSGILAIALKRLGAGRVTAVDIDPLAIEATRRNADLNAVQVEVAPALPPSPSFDGIVANILKNTLLEFAPRFHLWLKPGGFLILSGLLADQLADIENAYAQLGFRMEKKIMKGEWVSLLLIRK